MMYHPMFGLTGTGGAAGACSSGAVSGAASAPASCTESCAASAACSSGAASVVACSCSTGSCVASTACPSVVFSKSFTSNAFPLTREIVEQTVHAVVENKVHDGEVSSKDEDGDDHHSRGRLDLLLAGPGDPPHLHAQSFHVVLYLSRPSFHRINRAPHSLGDFFRHGSHR